MEKAALLKAIALANLVLGAQNIQAATDAKANVSSDRDYDLSSLGVELIEDGNLEEFGNCGCGSGGNCACL